MAHAIRTNSSRSRGGPARCRRRLVAQPQPRKLKVHISVDMEGIAGVVTGEQLGPTGFEYARFREFMTREALAAVTAAKAAGATEIIVADCARQRPEPADRAVPRRRPHHPVVAAAARHGGRHRRAGRRGHLHRLSRRHQQHDRRSRAHLLERQPDAGRAERRQRHRRIVECGDRRALQRPGGDDVRATMRRLRRCGKRSATSKAAETKRTLGFHSANTITPQASTELIGQKVRAGLGRLSELKPFKVSGPIVVDVSFKNYMVAEILAYLPLFERTDSHSIRFRAKDMAEASMIMNFIGEYRPDITP